MQNMHTRARALASAFFFFLADLSCIDSLSQRLPCCETLYTSEAPTSSGLLSKDLAGLAIALEVPVVSMTALGSSILAADSAEGLRNGVVGGADLFDLSFCCFCLRDLLLLGHAPTRTARYQAGLLKRAFVQEHKAAVKIAQL